MSEDFYRMQCVGLTFKLDRAAEVLKRLASMEAFDIPRAIDLKFGLDKELILRIEYAERNYKQIFET